MSGVDILGQIGAAKAAESPAPANTLNNAAGVEGGNAPKQSGETVETPAPKVPLDSSEGKADAASIAANEPGPSNVTSGGVTGVQSDVSKLPISGVQQQMANADLTKAGTSNNPGDMIRGTPSGSEVVEDIDDALARRDKAAELPEFGFTNLDDHPPLKPGDKIQGPNDRVNRDPTSAELEYGRRVLNEGNLSDEEKRQVANFKPAVIDPPIDENAPPDVPADPRKVAESRGMIFKKA